MARKRLKIAYLSDFSPLDRNMYSGGNARIYDSLGANVGDVTILPNTWFAAEPLRRLIHATPNGVNMRVRWRLHLALAQVVAAGVQRNLRQDRYDVVFCAYSFQSLAGLTRPYPLVTAYTSDATNTIFRKSELGDWHKSSVVGRAFDGWVEWHERRVMRAADLLLWPSDWIRTEANALYGLTPETSRVVPWGANIHRPPQKIVTPEIGRDRQVRLLLVGRDWYTKGGPKAFDTLNALRDEGVDAHLTVIGAVPPQHHRNAHVTALGELDKSDPAKRAIFDRAMAEAHFMLMPSHESYGFAFCEASAHGLPALCHRVGGVPVRNGVNGHALPSGATHEDFARVVLQYLENPEGYAALCRSSRKEYEDRLNWDSWGQTVADLLDEQVARLR